MEIDPTWAKGGKYVWGTVSSETAPRQSRGQVTYQQGRASVAAKECHWTLAIVKRRRGTENVVDLEYIRHSIKNIKILKWKVIFFQELYYNKKLKGRITYLRGS